MNPKSAGKALEYEIEKDLMGLARQTRDMDIRERTHRIWSSGSVMSDKGDVITSIKQLPKQLLIECKRRKTSTKKYGAHFDVKYEWLGKIKSEAEKRNCIPLFVLAFTGKRTRRRWVIGEINFMDLHLDLFPYGEDKIYVGPKYCRIHYNELNNFNGFTLLGQYWLIEWNFFLRKIKEEFLKPEIDSI